MIANHALYFAHLAAGGGVLPEHDAVVFDEAHRLEETAATWLGGRVSRAALRRLAADAERACREAARFRFRRGARPSRAGRRTAAECGCPAGRSAEAAPASARGGLALVAALEAVADALQVRPRRSIWSPSVRSRLRCRSKRCLDGGGLERVVWAEPDAIVWAPVDVSIELRRRLWEGGPTAILVSATLTTGEDASFVRRRLGLDGARELVVGSPFDYRDQALLYVPRTMPDPRDDGFLERVADEVEGSAHALAGTGAHPDLELPGARGARARSARPRPLRGARPGRRASRASARAFPRGDRLGTPRDLDLLAGRRHPGRGAVVARDRQAAVLAPGRSAATRRAARRSERPGATGSATTCSRWRCCSSAKVSGG